MTERTLRRRTLLGTAAAGVAVAGCGDSGGGGAQTATPTPTATAGRGGGVMIDFKQGDASVLNFAYALEQLEAAFYAEVVRNPAPGLSAEDRRRLTAIGQHELIHREFLRGVLGKRAIADLEPDFGQVDFGDRKSVLQTAQAFEDLGVSAYNGAAQFLTGGGELGLAPLQAAGEIVSVEARHASAIRTLLHGDSSGAFAPAAFDQARLPGEVLKLAAPFVKTRIELRNAPTQPRA